MSDLKESSSRWRRAGGWATELQDFFRARRFALEDVLRAQGCREGWIQGEVFRHFNTNLHLPFYCNVHPVPWGRTADFSAYVSKSNDAETLFVAELKVLGVSNYLPKNVTGRAADVSWLHRRLRRDGRVMVTNNAVMRRSTAYRESSLVRDYFRIIDMPEPTSVVRALMLVLDLRGEPDACGEVLRSIEFEKPARILFESEVLLVKCWFLRGPESSH